MKKLLYSLVFILIVILAILFIYNKIQVAKNTPAIDTQKTIQLCFYKEGENKTPQGYYDITWLKMNLTGDNVTGEFRNYPAEKDSKIGTFEGTVSKVDPYMMGRTADVMWNSLAEGMQVKEQLKIVFGKGNAQAGYGEMMDRGDGVYVYKDVSKLTYGMSMNDVACSEIDDRLVVEKYIRDNIKILVPEKPVLGGSWYALNIHVDPRTKTGTMEYEDGHINGKAVFTYVISDGQVLIGGINGRDCYAYDQVATAEAPYTVNEKIDIKKVGDKVTGKKSGIQTGPDMTNSYTGTLVGSVSGSILNAIYSYTIEGSAQKEKEIYEVKDDSLVKHRYTLREEKGVLVPDTTSAFHDVIYKKISCN